MASDTGKEFEEANTIGSSSQAAWAKLLLLHAMLLV